MSRHHRHNHNNNDNHNHDNHDDHNHHGNQDINFLRELREFIGQTVTIFTTSGGASGFGFTGILILVNNDFVRLLTEPGAAPPSPLSDAVLGDMVNTTRNGGGIGRTGILPRAADIGTANTNGTVIDIPVNRIAAFTHNTV